MTGFRKVWANGVGHLYECLDCYKKYATEEELVKHRCQNLCYQEEDELSHAKDNETNNEPTHPDPDLQV